LSDQGEAPEQRGERNSYWLLDSGSKLEAVLDVTRGATSHLNEREKGAGGGKREGPKKRGGWCGRLGERQRASEKKRNTQGPTVLIGEW